MGQDVKTCERCGMVLTFPRAIPRHCIGCWEYLNKEYGPFSPVVADPVNPPHYHGDLVMRIIEHFKLDFPDGQVLKYILRSGHKEGSPALQDYKKALWYLERKIRTLEKPDSVGIPPGLLEVPK